MYGFNLSPTKASQGGQVQVEQSDMRPTLNIPKMAKAWFSHTRIGETQYLINTPNAEVREVKENGVELPGGKMCRLRWNDTWLWFMEIKPTAAFVAKMAQQRICRHTGGAKAWVHLDPSDSDSRHMTRRHIHPKCHLCHPVTLRELTLPKSKVYHPDMYIHILHFPALNFSIVMHMPRIASTIQIIFQICWLLQEHPLVSTLSAVW